MQAILSKVPWPLPILDVMELQFKLSQLAFEQTVSWVLLKNVNLACSWLSQLEKELIVLNPPNSRKLFLTMETNTSKCLTPVTNPNEPLPGNRANLVDCLRSIFLACLSSGPNEKAQICFLLAW
ncbi:hypothetical protein PPACK8108_LOCUS1425 [Phakopsora pachyrhizi]|uniref:Uncharacterized protein n=1 Tax=Phakopsora pachyrhizi TaxID=170000 RepID=A0AAV0AIV8_PHAPC|nr:hypothetical protein PPACK8108_LOCUS1425 [Phakopsora pachyrhizi]